MSCWDVEHEKIEIAVLRSSEAMPSPSIEHELAVFDRKLLRHTYCTDVLRKAEIVSLCVMSKLRYGSRI